MSNRNYPKADWTNKADHLLFDLGYAYGLLAATEAFMQRALEELPIELTDEAQELCEALASFRKERLQNRNELYAAGEEAARKANPTCE
jgi:hypothetical protein